MTRTASELAEYLGAKLAGDARPPLKGLATPESPRDEERI